MPNAIAPPSIELKRRVDAARDALLARLETAPLEELRTEAAALDALVSEQRLAALGDAEGFGAAPVQSARFDLDAALSAAEFRRDQAKEEWDAIVEEGSDAAAAAAEAEAAYVALCKEVERLKRLLDERVHRDTYARETVELLKLKVHGTPALGVHFREQALSLVLPRDGGAR